MVIKNIVFDIGNVLVKWDPVFVVAQVFPEHKNLEDLTKQIFKSPIWYDLNLGKLTELQAIQNYHQSLNIDLFSLNKLMQVVRDSLLPIDNSFNLLNSLYNSNYSLYALTDNVKEIVTYLKSKYEFWDKFSGEIVSAEVGYLKPSPEIYYCLINTYSLNPRETIFIDDILVNVEGARSVGMHAIQFITAEQCIDELKKFQVTGVNP